MGERTAGNVVDALTPVRSAYGRLDLDVCVLRTRSQCGDVVRIESVAVDVAGVELIAAVAAARDSRDNVSVAVTLVRQRAAVLNGRGVRSHHLMS